MNYKNLLKKKLIAAVIVSTTFACNQKEKESTPITNKSTIASTPTDTNKTNANTTAITTDAKKNANTSISGAKKTGVNIDKYPQIMVDGTQVSTIDFKDDNGADITEKYYIQKVNNTITLTQIQAMRGVAKGSSKSIYLINTTGINVANIVVEEVKNKNYTGGKFYVVNLECATGNNCMNHSYEDIGVGKPTERMETLTQVSFTEKDVAENFANALKASL